MLAVHFGAGNIGRGFIGLLLNQAGYEVVFVDVNQSLVNELNLRGSYRVQLAAEGTPFSEVRGVRAIQGQDVDAVAEAIAHADLVTTAVGPNILQHIAGAIAQGISRRLKSNARPLNVIACENMIGGSAQLKAHVYRFLSESDQAKADGIIAFPNAAVDRIVPLQQHEDKLLVTVEPFFEWVVDQSQMVGETPAIEGVTYVPDLAPYIERKLFTVNTGHAVIAYLGYLHGYATIDEALRDAEIKNAARGAFQETGALLLEKYRFEKETHEAYVEKILGRYANPMLSDHVTRVARSPIRKLSSNDRLVGPAMQCVERALSAEYLGLAIAAALLFDYPEDPEAELIQSERKQNGLEQTMRTYTGIPEGNPLTEIVLRHVRSLHEQIGTH
ncbi:mannitol-1-phosphate 5-dehydrogenase [Brevibacillus choshinensis]|uniref:mannitol-1-phosphate 5-dehydrogenase n=1 Tax=Brevibacillus choshinensis TaxID=54911 RepID=UPI002E1F5F1B|nr:mannitol-1-phosphate 5-dehydrogenase [Brevibacillus choshinensis]MED4583676.1 mannitol-1-phosphate 5-dehydrogenase [Brevibacillus choshinensis]